MGSKAARLRFERHGRSPHLLIERAADLAKVPQLDAALWVASSAPVDCISLDCATIASIDSDNNGRITRDEIAHAVRWLLDVLNDPGPIDSRSNRVEAKTLNTSNSDATRIAQSIAKMTSRDGARSDSPGSVNLNTVQKIIKEIQDLPASGSGVVSTAAAPDRATAELMQSVIAVTGGSPHPGGSTGVDTTDVETFGKAVSEYRKWTDTAPPDFEAVEDRVADGTFVRMYRRVDEFFALCTLLATSPAEIPKVMEFPGNDEPITNLHEKLPLALPKAEGVLSLDTCANAFLLRNLEDFFTGIVSPLLGNQTTSLNTREWAVLRPKLEAINSWLSSKPTFADRVASLGDIGESFGDASLRQLTALIKDSEEAALDLENVRLVERLILYQMHIMEVVNNFVSFPFLYSRTGRAAFERGCLVMDGRRFNLAVSVQDRARHILVARNSSMFVLYVSVAEKSGAAFEVAVPVTAGRKGNLAPGKRGVFIDLEGVERDAEIKEIIINPISITEAIVSPFRRIGAMVTGKIEAITQEAQSQLDSFASGNVGAFAANQSEAPANKAGITGGLLLGGSVAFAAVGSAVAYITNTLTQLKWWQFLAGIGGAVALVILPATILAFIKLRGRDLSSIIEASGWAVNARMRLTHRLGREFTRRPQYPKGSKGVPAHRRA